MAKRSQLAREEKRQVLSSKLKEKRDQLRNAVVDPKLSDEDRMQAMLKLTKMPRDSSRCRINTRCQFSGVSRAVYRKFKLNRISFRNMALAGLLPGVTKSSW